MDQRQCALKDKRKSGQDEWTIFEGQKDMGSGTRDGRHKTTFVAQKNQQRPYISQTKKKTKKA